MTNILKIDSSVRREGSQSRRLASLLADRLGGAVTTRDLADQPVPFIDEDWINANFTAEEERTPEQRARLAQSDALIAELEAADTLIIGVPVYNFAVPASLKSWIDHVARARKTFRYTESGPEGLLRGKKAYLVVASGGTAVGSEIDFATGYLKHMLGFIGIHDVTIVAADQLAVRAEESIAEAEGQIAAVDLSEAA